MHGIVRRPIPRGYAAIAAKSTVGNCRKTRRGMKANATCADTQTR